MKENTFFSLQFDSLLWLAWARCNFGKKGCYHRHDWLCNDHVGGES